MMKLLALSGRVRTRDFSINFLLSFIICFRYANRAKNIKNKPKINEDPKDALLREYQEEIKKLRDMLASQSQGGSAPAAIGE